MLTISREHAAGILREETPAAFCEDGGAVAFETRDCYDDNDISEENPYGTLGEAIENPATGPLFVRGAEPGDVLQVEILEISLRKDGVMRTSLTAGAFVGLYAEKSARRFPFSLHPETGKQGFYLKEDIWLDCDTMIGVIGTAAPGEGVPTHTPGPHGGNMDCRRIVAGSVVYLPVYVRGGLLSLGDLHARMGDGEVMICGMETAGTVTVRVRVRKEVRPAFREALPLVVQGGDVMTVQSAPTLDGAAVLAAQRMRTLAAEELGLSDVDSGMLLSLAGNLAVCQLVNPLKTVRCELSAGVLFPRGLR